MGGIERVEVRENDRVIERVCVYCMCVIVSEA